MSNEIDGIVEILNNGYGFIREQGPKLPKRRGDVYVSGNIIRENGLRNGCHVVARTRSVSRKEEQVSRIYEINGLEPEEWLRTRSFRDHIVTPPTEMLRFETTPEEISMRVVDLICPVGKGQRGLLVSPPKAGKTTVMRQMANAAHTNHPDLDIIVVLIDERPEEVTEMVRGVPGRVFASSNDEEYANHLRIAELSIEIAKRQVEAGRDVFVLIDSLTRIGRAYNLEQPGTGRTMTGGIDSRALEIPRRIFGAARNFEDGGSLTIIATALIQTQSRMDEFIYQEFKGTGNMEMVLSRDIANQWIFPAINIHESGTRKIELLVGNDIVKYTKLRRKLVEKEPLEALEALLQGLEKAPTNQDFLRNVK